METELAEQTRIRESMVTLQEEIQNTTERCCKDLTKSNAKLQRALNKLSEDNERLKVENAMLRKEVNMKNEGVPSNHDSICIRKNSISDSSAVENGDVFQSRNSAMVMAADMINTLSEQNAVPSWLQNECLNIGRSHEEELDSASKTRVNIHIDCRSDKKQNNVQMSDDGPDAEYFDCKGKGGLQGKGSGTDTCSSEGCTILPRAHLQQAVYSRMDTTEVDGIYDREKDWKLKGA